MTVRIGMFGGLVGATLAAGTLLPTSILFAANASADWCYSADCVPNVARNVTAGTPCVPQPRRAFAYGLEPAGGTVVCNAAGAWVSAGPLIGVYNVTMPCPALNLSAQGSDGIALQCLDLAYGSLQWAHRAD
ncbi:hypothetical protein [Mycolicibacterium stellerae]|uniref:hypothetical protein n=1 Tax=Mycolicibacterium stellerae TaxID=2358193 RepID=UPI001F377884|nr:hypothetical protein [Mycolicibacterium stellerae]